ncbi:Cyclic nucleotide-binding protein [Pseudocohnilembus persalinus]|uniref:Cyclic nucleotide-binding protein n=1 Tax=Pseudocohnilembus persalinus TaxID=266149 RepID=A0A0V0R4S2_PSEPJ|nr:Cyclic nucleotide-binding protein [Pseudocohnilembus persalinus]|eukprot:KRX09470.1 Cyclic nucleotide-binding protein [Pseudocohnilembus persalinus]
MDKKQQLFSSNNMKNKYKKININENDQNNKDHLKNNQNLNLQDHKNKQIIKYGQILNNLLDDFNKNPLNADINYYKLDKEGKLWICKKIFEKNPENRTQEEIKILVQCTRDVKYFQDMCQNGDTRIHSLCMKNMIMKTANKGEKVIQQQTIGTTFWVILQGQVNITKNRTTEDQNKNFIKYEEVVHTQGAGTYFGELALQKANNIRQANVVATEESIFAVLDKDNYQKILRNFNDKQLFMEEFGKMRLLKGWKDIIIRNLYDTIIEKTYTYNNVVYLENDDSEFIYFVSKGEFDIKKNVKFDPQQYRE